MRVLRVVLIVFGVLALPALVLSLFAGAYWAALSALLVGSGAFLMAGWAWGFPTAFPAREWVALGLIAAGFVVIGLYVAAIILLLVVLVLNVGTGRFLLRRLADVEFEPVGPDDVMPKAKPLVAEFEDAQFRSVGGYRWRVPVHRKVVTNTIMAGPDGDRWAVVTDRVWLVASRFGDRWLVTTSSGLSPTLPGVVRQTLARARPAELVSAHQGAVELLAGRAVEPDRLTSDAEVLDAALELEQHGIRFASTVPMKSIVGIETRRTSENPVLGDDDRSRRRIDSWLATPALEGSS